MYIRFSYRVFGYTGETNNEYDFIELYGRFSYRVFGYTGETDFEAGRLQRHLAFQLQGFWLYW